MPHDIYQPPSYQLLKSDRILYFGPSMYPTLRDFDIVEISPYGKNDVQPGDIVVFPSPQCPGKQIIHRVISIEKDSIRTQGDNCQVADGWILTKNDILGYIVQVKRRGREYRLSGGFSGKLFYRYVRISNSFRFYWIRILMIPYHMVASSCIIARFTTRLFTCSMIEYQGTSRWEIQLHLGRRVIGRLREDTTGWNIQPPFRIFIDETKLPSLVREKPQKKDKI
jgi:signal peptidase I